MKISKDNAEHYIWGGICDGWHLVKTNELSIIHEKMPSKTSEVRHLHQKAKQFFFVLSGQATIELNEKTILLNEYEGIEILPGIPHQMMNNSDCDIEFVVVSTPTSKGDRILVE
ncbi:cupin domain-containing protein [Clostridium sp. 'White wine YQ']|uniref:cupin domain-containing protein n=1 Tax=Clostridium sp. 'White wine YQ' TaxID=3027474 RepID=UPI002366E392|nr:cupin domain-containing protein [Clostridium sp. 'White wine YQ']MDD7793048.1 cupin domain-containing protein [Clostridium sp. 'White wine YQ']